VSIRFEEALMLRRHSKLVVTGVLGLAAASLVKGGRTGTVLGIPYDWRRPTVARAKSRLWNPAEPRLVVPRVFGLGWDINFARLLGRRPEV
jgi:uncharacterized membrane protein